MARDRIWYALARNGIEIPVATHAVSLTPLPPPEPEDPAAVLNRRVATLNRVGLLNSLGNDLLRQLAADSLERVFAAAEPVIRQGDTGQSMFVILSGRVEVTVRDQGGPEVRLAELMAGDFFGEMSLMTGAPRVASVTATEETRVMEVSKDSFRRVLEARPELIDELGRALHVRMAERAQAVAGITPTGPEVQDICRKIRDFFSL
jgi:CRP-like cAMP-binding protein